ncbi:MAG: hypothetical protein NTW32_04260 [Chloroflexi bacterium]|nr:hypothetical protein [Chloroflexota bacterium]
MKIKRSNLLNIIFFLIHLSAYAYFFSLNNWNSNSRYGLTMAIIDQGTLAIDAFHNTPEWFTGDQSYFHGHYYSDKAPGTSFLAVIFFGPIYAFCKLSGIALGAIEIKVLISILSIALPSAVGALLVFIVAQKITGETSPAFWASISVTLGSMFWPFSTTFISHALTGTFIFASFFLGFRAYSAGKIPNKRTLFWIGLTMGFAFITEYTTALVIIWVLAYLFFKAVQRKQFLKSFLLIGLGSVIAVLPAVIYNQLVFRNPLASGYSHLTDKQFATGMAQGLMGIGYPNWRVLLFMTIHPAQGIFWQSPALLFAIPPYLKLTAQKYKAELIMALGMAASLLITMSGYYMWWGGESFAIRHLTPIMLFLVIPLASLASRLKPFLIASTILSVLQMFLVAATSLFVPDTWVKNLSLLDPFRPFQYSVLYSTIFPQFLIGQLTGNLGRSLITNPFCSLVPFILIEGLMFGLFYGIVTGRLKLKWAS